MMRHIDLPARGRASRRLAALAALLAVGTLTAPLAAAPVRAAWTSDTPVEQVVSTRPAVAMDAGGNLGVAWQESSSEPGIRFATDAGGTWATERITTGDDWAPDVVFDGSVVRVAFVRFGAGAGLYLATKSGGTWDVGLLRADVLAWSPSIARDAAGALHIAYASEGFVPGVWYLTNKTGSWVATRISTGTWDSEPSLALDPAGAVHVAFARYDRSAPGLYLATNASGSWAAATRLTTNPDLDDYPALVIDAAGKRHIAAMRFHADPPAGLLYLTDESGAFVTSQIGAPAGGEGVGIPAIGLDSSGEPEVVVRLDTMAIVDDTLWRYSSLPWGTPERLLTGAERSEGFPDILRDATGRLVVAYRGAWKSPGVGVHREDPDADVMIAPSVLLGPPALATDPAGARYLAFDRYATDATDGTSSVSDVTGSWVDETVAATHGTPDLALTNITWTGTGYSSTRRIALPDRLFSSTASGWDAHPFAVGGGTDVSISTASIEWKLAYLVPGVGVRVMHSNLAEELATADGADLAPDIVAGGAGTEHYLLAFTRSGALYSLYRYWSDPLLETPRQIDSAPTWDPAAIAATVSSVTRQFIAYDKGGSAAGIYLADNATYMGDWESRRMSRAHADVTPSVASVYFSVPTGPHSDFYVTWARACGGPSPGIYLATDRTGTWATSLVVAGCGLSAPSVSALPDGRAVISYLDEGRGIVVLGETVAAAPASAAPAFSGAAGRPAARIARATEGGRADARGLAGTGLDTADVLGRRGAGSSTTSIASLGRRFAASDR